MLKSLCLKLQFILSKILSLHSLFKSEVSQINNLQIEGFRFKQLVNSKKIIK